MANTSKPDKPSFVETDSEELRKQFDAIKTPTGEPTPKQKTPETLLQELLELPRPWKSNDDKRHNLLIKNLEDNLKPSLIEIIKKHKTEETIRTLYKTEVTFGEAAINAYDNHKAKFAAQHAERDAMLHSLPQNSAAYRVQKRFCDAMDKVEKDFISKLTDPNYFRKELHNKPENLQRKIDVAQKGACLKSYNGDLKIINQQTPAIREQFSQQFQQVFPQAKDQAWIQRSQQNIKELQAIANPKPTRESTKTNDIAAKRAALAEQQQKAMERNQTIRGTVAEQTKTVEKTAAAVAEKSTSSNITKTPTPKPSSSAIAKKDDESSEQKQVAKKEHHNDESLLTRVGGVLGYILGSAIQFAVKGAWGVAKAAAAETAEIAKAGVRIMQGKELTAAQAESNNALPAPAPEASAPKNEDEGPSLFVRGTTGAGKIFGKVTEEIVRIGLNGGIRLAVIASEALGKIASTGYHAITDKKQDTSLGQEGDLKTGHSKATTGNAMTKAAVNSTLSVTSSNDTKLDNAPSTTPSPMKNK
jgi:hypothetical protein